MCEHPRKVRRRVTACDPATLPSRTSGQLIYVGSECSRETSISKMGGMNRKNRRLRDGAWCQRWLGIRMSNDTTVSRIYVYWARAHVRLFRFNVVGGCGRASPRRVGDLERCTSDRGPSATHSTARFRRRERQGRRSGLRSAFCPVSGSFWIESGTGCAGRRHWSCSAVPVWASLPTTRRGSKLQWRVLERWRGENHEARVTSPCARWL